MISNFYNLGFGYDARSRLISASDLVFTNNECRLDLIVSNRYDHIGRRVKKITRDSEITFFYDGWNLVEERIAYANGTTATINYYWGKDLSGTLQGAGGVGGLLYLTVHSSSPTNSPIPDAQLYIPCYDNNGNVTRYLDANGNTVVQYGYDAFGDVLAYAIYGSDFFRHRFSTKYFDDETGLYYYGYRFYCTWLMRWLTRDPIGEEVEVNLYRFCRNSGLTRVDINGLWPWTPIWSEQTARQAVIDKISEMRKNGYNFAADALAHFVSDTSRNIDLSQHANEISSNIHWQRSFVDSVLANLKKKDPKGTGQKITIGDIDHAANFDKPMPPTDNIGTVFTKQFDHRFYQTQSMGLFYALYGSRYSYYGTASWKQCNNSTILVHMVTTKIDVDVKVVCWDRLTYPDGMGRTAINSYSAANYLEKVRLYNRPYLFLRWNEKGRWTSTFWSTINGGGTHLKKEE